MRFTAEASNITRLGDPWPPRSCYSHRNRPVRKRVEKEEDVARVSTLEVPQDQMNEALRNVREQVLPLIQQQDRFKDRT